MKDGNFSFASLISGRDEFEESFWPSFTDVMMVITMIFLIVTVAVVLTNTRLLDDLRHSVKAEQSAQQSAQKAAEEALQASRQAQKAEQLAEFQLKANASLEEQLEYLQQRSSSLEMELLRSRAAAEATASAASERDALLSRLEVQQSEYGNTLKLREQSIAMLQTELNSKNTEIAGLTSKADQSEKQLLSLQGEYTELDQKYQKLLKPARSSKGKQVVEVVYSKSGYNIRKPGEATLRNIGRAALDAELSALKAQHGTELYVKVVIPDNSGLSYNEAWRFTSEMLAKYDYYTAP
jgi:phage-related tail protein